MWPVSGSVKRGAFHGFGLKWSGPMPRPTTRSTASAAVSPANPAMWRVPRTRARRQATAAATAAVLTAYRPIAQGALRSVPLPRPCRVAAPQTAKLR